MNKQPYLSRRSALVGMGCAALVAAVPNLAFAEGLSEDTELSADVSAGLNEDFALSSEVFIEAADDSVTVNGEPIGTDASSSVYASNDVWYYEDRDTYDSGNVYGEGDASERHSAQEAADVCVINIAQPGTYCLSGTFDNTQISIDLGEDAYDDIDARVVLILAGADITCDIAPALVVYNVYECDGDWSVETASPDVDTSAAGIRLVLADGSVNTITGSHVARIYEDTPEGTAIGKIDGAIHSNMSINIEGEVRGDGVLNVIADNEGIESDLHLTINGGVISIKSQDDGLNSNEDYVSVTTVNGGTLHILAGLGEEGDGVDSNGYLVINDGVVIAMANPASDSGLDSDMGSYINGGTVVAFGSTMDWAESDSDQVTMNLQFARAQDAGDAVVVSEQDGTIIFAYDPSEDEIAGSNIRTYQGAILSCANFEVGQTYSVYIGGTISGEEVQGVYDVATITDYTDGVQQAYTGTDIAGGPGGAGGPGDQQPGGEGGFGEGMGDPGEGGAPEGEGAPGEGAPGEGGAPEGEGGDPGMGMGDPGVGMGDQQPGGEGMGDPGVGMGDPGEGGAPEGEGAPGEGGDPGMGMGDPGVGMGDQQPGGEGGFGEGMGEAPDTEGSGTSDLEASTEFYMQDKVNAFSGVTAA